MEAFKPITVYFKDDGVAPNNSLPVLLYLNVFQGLNKYATLLEQKFQENNWIGNWRDIVLTEDHYHSTTHEVLGISSGEVNLWLGGESGQRIEVTAGDVLVIPAGVSHRSLSNTNAYEVIGGYPDGLTWDMIYCEPEAYQKAKTRIEGLSLPKTDPIFGIDGPLLDLWK